MDKRIGAQLYTIREFCKSREDFENSMKKIREIGYKQVQVSGVGPFGEEEIIGCGDFIRKVCDDNGLVISCTHRPLQSLQENFDAEIEFHNKLGCKIIGLGGLPKEAREDKDVLIETIKSLNELSDKLNEKGFTFTYHNHAFEFRKIDDKTLMDYILEHGRFSLLIDVYWLAHAGLNPVKFIKAHADRIACVHFKDKAVTTGNETAYAEVGCGNLDWDEIIAACEEADIKFAQVEQDICSDDPFECLKRSYNFLAAKGFN